jgi:hypothetical protein
MRNSESGYGLSERSNRKGCRLVVGEKPEQGRILMHGDGGGHVYNSGGQKAGGNQ